MGSAERFVELLRAAEIAEGRRLGKVELLSRLLARHFGALPEEDARWLRAARHEQLDNIADRVVDAKNLDDVFGRKERR